MAAVDPARNTTYTLLENEGKGRTRTGHNVIHGTKKYKNKNGKLFYGISGKKNAITYMSDILSILKDCPYIIKQHGEININNNTHTLFIPDAGNQDLLEWSNKLIEERIKLQNNSTQLGKNAVSKHIQNTSEIIWKIVQQIAAAIQCMHSKKIKHLDIKCENIVVDDNNNIVLIDWENAQIEDPCILHKNNIMTAQYLPLNTIDKIKKSSLNEVITINGYYHDIYAFTCILFLIIITNLLSEPYRISCIKIIKYILFTIIIDIDTWLSTQVFNNLMSDMPINANIKKNPWYKYIKDQYDKSNYNPETDNDASSIIKRLTDSLELSKHDFSKNVNENWLAREASLANHNDSWLANEQNSQSSVTPPPGWLAGGARFRKKHTRRKYRHSRKSFSRTKKH